MQFAVFFRAAFEICVLWILFYQLYRVFRNSRAAAILGGLVAIVLLGGILLELAHASVLKQIAGAIIGPGTILIVLFQPELRSALAKLGTTGVSKLLSHSLLRKLKFLKVEEQKGFVDKVLDSVSFLKSRKFGALIVICRNDKLAEYVKPATKLDAVYSRELVGTIFMPKTLLHDGAVIVDNERIVAAAAILPVTQKELERSLGLRHRAALGLSEVSDAVVIIVSEETGSIALAVGPMLHRELTSTALGDLLNELLYPNESKGKNKVSGNA